MIDHSQVGSDEDLAREVLIVARGIAPCLDSFVDDSDAQKDALAVIRRVYKVLAARGSHLVKSQRIGSAAVEYVDVASAFDGQPARALRALCSSAATAAGHSRGEFPKARPISRVWPED